MKRLCNAALGNLPPQIDVPAYDRTTCGVGIVHLGIGAFHRAHQAVYTDDVLAQDGGNWAIVGVSLRNRAVHDQLTPQNSLFSVTALSGAERHCRVIGSVKDVIFAPSDHKELLVLMAAETTAIVSLTVTEKGYYRDPASGCLLRNDPAIISDIANPDAPATAIGLLARALNMRRQAGIVPFTVLSCDNLPDNGISLRRVVTEFAGLISAQLANWIDENVSFPCTMVDRIVPAMNEEGLTSVATDLGLRDEGAIITEPFSQWVVEDDFPLGRPAWEKAGVMLVDDVAPYELIKLRLLNGAHSSLAYLGYLGGLEYVSDCMDNAALRDFITALMHEEIRQTLTAPEGFDINAYIEALLARFANPSLHHRCWQIAMDGTQKLPQRLLGTIRERLSARLPIDRLALSVAGWIHYASGTDLNGNPIDVRDPLADMLRERLTPCLGNALLMTNVALELREVFGSDLGDDTAFRKAISESLSLLMSQGAPGAVRQLTLS